MAMLSNPRPHAIRLTLSNGLVRTIGPWGLAMLPDAAVTGARLEITFVEVAVPSSLPDANVAGVLTAPDTRRAA